MTRWPLGLVVRRQKKRGTPNRMQKHKNAAPGLDAEAILVWHAYPNKFHTPLQSESEVDAGGRYDAAEAAGPILVHDEVVAWRQQPGTLISGVHVTIQPIFLLKLNRCPCSVLTNMLSGVLEVHLLLP